MKGQIIALNHFPHIICLFHFLYLQYEYINDSFFLNSAYVLYCFAILIQSSKVLISSFLSPPFISQVYSFSQPYFHAFSYAVLLFLMKSLYLLYFIASFLQVLYVHFLIMPPTLPVLALLIIFHPLFLYRLK